MAIKDARFDALGQLVHDHIPEAAQRSLLYVEFVDDGVVSPSLFYELVGGTLHYVEYAPGIDEELFRLQVIFGPDVKTMEFELKGSKFHTRFTYTDQFDLDVDASARRDTVLQKYFGHASAHYPPF
jgi:hypothetical protein